MFHVVISGQSSTLIGRIDLEVSCGTGDNTRKKMLTFEVVSFNIGYNCILEMSFLLEFMVIIHTAYATLKMFSPKDVITIKAHQCDVLACENATLKHDGRFDDKVAREQAVKVAKMHDFSTSSKLSVPKPPSAKKGTYVALASNQHPTDHQANEKKEVDDKEVLVNPSKSDKKLWISTGLKAK
jgi:hypothetical protein